MTDVVIVDAVRTPDRAPRRWPVHHPPGRPARHRPEGPDRAVGHRPGRGGPDRRRLRLARSASRPSTSPAPPGWPPASPNPVAATTVDTQCGSSQQATNLATTLVAAGVVDVAVACGVEVMSRVPIGSSGSKKLGFGEPIPKPYFGQLRVDLPVRGCRAHRRQVGHLPPGHRRVRPALPAAAAAGLGRGPLRHPDRARRRPRRSTTRASLLDTTHPVTRDEGLRETTPREAGPAQAGGPARRRAHRRHRLADLRRRGRGAAHDGRQGRGARAHARGPHRRHLPRGRRPRPDAHRPHRRHPPPARPAPA